VRSRRIGRLVKAGRRRLGRIWRRLRSKHAPLGLLFLLALVGGGLLVVTLPTHHKAEAPQMSVPRAITVRAAPPPVHVTSAGRLNNPPRKAAAPLGPVEEAALRPPPPLPAPPRAEPAWLRYAVPAPPGGGRPLVAVVLDDLGT
jgi:hypothetical protein